MLQTKSLKGWRDDSGVKVQLQPRGPGFEPWDSHDGRGEPTPKGCPLNSTFTAAWAPTHIRNKSGQFESFKFWKLAEANCLVWQKTISLYLTNNLDVEQKY